MLGLLLPWNLAAYAVISAATFWLWICSGWFQNKLIGWKNDYESREREAEASLVWGRGAPTPESCD